MNNPENKTRIVEIKIPKEGFLQNEQMTALFGRSTQTLMRWAKKGIIPMPCNYSEKFEGVVEPTSPRFWDAEDVWKAFGRLRGASNVD